MKIFKIFFFIFCFLYIFNITSHVQANQDVDKISKNLRCLICQGQSVYDSQSDFALTIKMLIKNKLQEGESEDEIYDYLKTLYGEWIVYDPEFNKKNLLLWVFPLILFIFGGLLIYKKVFINEHKK
ncbi:MAG: cytochrome c-type biogenesis protein CcmH [Pelagibacteraceae bacterium]|jgi:cytochrome c-type biogenesis protein CcmH|nr:cytochrome c-type biogenesis protein CcmH [Pelagibacteraceae bacterium]|tara:strand:+ start:272 stop:649 length:378 start_codon:yes stop_codon:yes gene_type:complete